MLERPDGLTIVDGRQVGHRRTSRTLTWLHPALAGRYVALVAAIADAVESRLATAVAANRVVSASVTPPTIRLAPWRVERAEFAARLARLSREAPYLVFADVRDCYGAIRPAVVEASLERLGCEPASVRAVGSFLRSLARRGVRGLPIGPDASAVLANAVLARVDDSLAAARLHHLRWVDDVVVATAGRGGAAAVLELLAEALADVGLELNELKTKIVRDPRTIGDAGTVSLARWRAGVG
jgi:hypothetical protein